MPVRSTRSAALCRATLALAAFIALSAQAATPADLLAAARDEARRAQADFVPSPARGETFFHREFGQSKRMPACASCHTDDPRRPGRHVVTDKPIAPLAPNANGERFTSAAKTEKWFRRNCTEVVGRECSAAEKADLIAYLEGVR